MNLDQLRASVIVASQLPLVARTAPFAVQMDRALQTTRRARQELTSPAVSCLVSSRSKTLRDSAGSLRVRPRPCTKARSSVLSGGPTALVSPSRLKALAALRSFNELAVIHEAKQAPNGSIEPLW